MEGRIGRWAKSKPAWFLAGAASLGVAAGIVIYRDRDENSSVASANRPTAVENMATPKTSEAASALSLVIPSFQEDLNGTPYAFGGVFDKEKYEKYPLDFRFMLAFLREEGHPLAGQLEKVYENIKASENGVEYTDVITYTSDGHIKFSTEPFQPKSGDTFEVFDPSVNDPGIFLRDDPQFRNGDSFLYSQMEVKLGDSTIVSSAQGNDIFWRVEVTNDVSPSFENDIKATNGSTGYISQQYLGAHIIDQRYI